MTRACFLVVLSLAAASWGVGCRAGAKSDMEEKIDPVAAQQVPGAKIFREWKKVYSVELRSGQSVRNHVGFVERRFSDADPEGKSFVLDRTHVTRGFVLPSGRAFLFESGDPVSARDLGNTGIENGVKRILGAPGGIELETVTGSSSP